MPAFNHMRGDEVEALLAYLDQLADVPGGNHVARLVTESAARVGEHMVKGTCHICHDATGPGGGHMTMMRGVTPSLASLPEDQSLSSMTLQVPKRLFRNDDDDRRTANAFFPVFHGGRDCCGIFLP